MAEHFARSDWRVLRSAVYRVQWVGLVVICCGLLVKGWDCEDDEDTDC
jgi:hypothetical protein